MKLEQLIVAYNEAVFDTDRDRALQLIQAAVDNGVSPEEIVFEVVIPALDQTVNALSDDQPLNLAQHFMISQIAAEITAEMIPRFKTRPDSVGRIVIGTAQGDLHSLGKQIVSGCLTAQMVECIDLGINVPPDRFVDEAVAHQAGVIGISAMMIHTARGENGCVRVREILRDRGLEDTVKIVVGGAPFRFDRQLYRRVQADAWAEDGVTGAKVIADLIREVRQ